MALVRIDLIEGRTDEEITKILDACHEALLEAFEATSRDRYQILSEHKPGRFRVENAALGHAHTDNVVIVSVTGRQRPDTEKLHFNSVLCKKLKDHCRIEAHDVVVYYLVNTYQDHAVL